MVFSGFGFLTEPCLFSFIDAVRKPHLPGSVHIFLDFTIYASRAMPADSPYKADVLHRFR